MQQNQRIIFYILILIAGAGWVTLSAQPGASNQSGTIAPQAGFTAPDFSLKTPDGTTYTLSEMKGRAVLLNLWATWCPPCRAEMPAIERVYQEYKDRGLIVLALNMTHQDNPLQVAPFIASYHLSFPILLEETGEVARAYNLRSLPSSYFIDRNGVISAVVIGGPMSDAQLKTQIEKIIQ